MTVEFHGQPNYARALELLLRMEAERYGAKIKEVRVNDIDERRSERTAGEDVRGV